MIVSAAGPGGAAVFPPLPDPYALQRLQHGVAQGLVVKLRGAAHDVADDDDGRTAYRRCHQGSRQFSQRRDQLRLRHAGCRLDHGYRCAALLAAGQQGSLDFCAAGNAHIDHQGQIQFSQRRPVGIGLRILAVAGNENRALAPVPMRERHAYRRRRRQATADAVDHFDFYTGSQHMIALFATTTEDERVAAFQAHDTASGLRF